MDEIKYLLAFSQIGRFGAKKLKLLQNHFPDMAAAWQAPLAEYAAAGLDEKLAEEIIIRRRQINPDEELEKINKENVQVVTIDDETYPKLLKEIHCPPFILYYKGDLNNLHEQAVAVVGTRKISTYGKQVTPAIVQELINQDIIIVSGLALGVDSLAHLTAVQNRKTTIAVLGSGLARDNIYPTTNRTLAEEIVSAGGLVVSEFPLDMMPLRHNFPARNRLISGLSLGTLVIEAGETSGALITAQFALEQNREVFAIPGAITNPLSAGTNNLIKRGAKLVNCGADIFEELNLKQLKQHRANQTIIPDSPEEGAILKHLLNEPRHINELVKESDLSIQEINSTLMLLEMKGRVRNLGNMTYVANK